MINRNFRLRWVFDFAGNKPTRKGMWSEPGDVAKDGAWRVNKDGLVHAAIERECMTSYKIETVAECDGHDFVNFEWMAAASVPALSLIGSQVSKIDLRGAIVGLRLVTRDLNLECLVDGRQMVKPRPEAEKKLHLAGFGR